MEKKEKIAQLTMDVTKYPAWSIDTNQHRLHRKDLACRVCQDQKRVDTLRCEQLREQVFLIPLRIQAVHLMGDVFCDLASCRECGLSAPFDRMHETVTPPM